MKDIKAIILASLICVFGSSYALADGFSVGFTGAIADIEAAGSETEGKPAVVETNNAQVNNTTGVFSVFAEMNDVMGSGISVGVDYIPMTADVSSSVRKRTDVETSVSGTDTTTSTSRTQNAQAEIDQHVTLYATYDIAENIYVKAGYVTMDLNTLESLGTGSAYGNIEVEGYTIGLGAQADLMANMFARVEASYTDYEDISLTSTTSRTGVTSNNKIDASLDVSMLKASIGYKF